MNRISNARFVARCHTCGRAEGEWFVFPSNWTTMRREAWMSDNWTDLQGIASFALSERAMAVDLANEEAKQQDHWGDEKVTPQAVDGDGPGR